MEKFKEYITAILLLVAILSIGVPLTMKEKRIREEKKLAKKREIAKYEEVERFRQPMVRNGGSLEIGYLFKDAYVYTCNDAIFYSKDYASQKEGLRVFDSLFVEICKHHCDSLAPHRFVNEYNREFECGHVSASITLTYEGRCHDIEGEKVDESWIEIKYKAPHKLGSLDERWEQYLVVENK